MTPGDLMALAAALGPVSGEFATRLTTSAGRRPG